jgi:hypothetical protein
LFDYFLIDTLWLLLHKGFFFALLGFEHRALFLWDRCSATYASWATTTALFTLFILEIGSWFLPRPDWTTLLLFYTFRCCWNDRHMTLHPAIG